MGLHHVGVMGPARARASVARAGLDLVDARCPGSECNRGYCACRECRWQGPDCARAGAPLQGGAERDSSRAAV